MLKELKWNKTNFNFIGYVSSIFTILIIPMSYFLPQTISWENGFLENIQVVVLLFGGVLAFSFYQKSKQNKIHAMWLTASSFFLLLVGRELSWGRVFFPTKMTGDGPKFIAMSQVPHHMLLNIFIGIFIAVIVVGMIFTIPWKTLLFKVPVPKLYFSLTFIGVIFSLIGDHGWIFSGYRGETVEELGELLFYFLMDMLVLYYYHYLNEI